MANISNTLPLNRASVQLAHERIKNHIHLTPVLTSTTLSDLASTPQAPAALLQTPWEGQRPAHPRIRFFFKCENYQRIGAFKIRGAFHALSRLSKEELARGVVTHSSGSTTFLPPTASYFLEDLANLEFIAKAIMRRLLPLPPVPIISRRTSSCPQYLHLQK